MPVNALPSNPTIEVIFRGLVVSHVIDGESVAQLGAVKGAPCHEARITVTEFHTDGTSDQLAETSAFNLEKDIFLDVENASKTKIYTFERAETDTNKFDRSADKENVNDFRFHIDFERDIYKNKTPTVDQTMIGPVFSIQSAVFFTQRRTDRIVNKVTKDGSSTAIGFAAQEIAARIKLDQPQSKAFLRNNGNIILTVDASSVANGKTYVIEFDCECDHTAPKVSGAAAGRTDFSLVHNAVGKNLSEDEIVDIVEPKPTGPARGGPADPQVFCQGGNTRQPLR